MPLRRCPARLATALPDAPARPRVTRRTVGVAAALAAVVGVAAATAVGPLPAATAATASPAVSSAVTSAVTAAPAAARGTAPRPRTHRVVRREASFVLTNTADAAVPLLDACGADGAEHVVRGRLVGPRGGAAATGGVLRVHVLVHDAGTGGWAWDLPGADGVGYATALARRGETALVLDRLGYDRSPLADGDATCLDAQAHQLHQVVQRLYAGLYQVRGERRPEHAAHVVVHGHGTGATVAELEAAAYDDTSGLVLMSSPTAPPTPYALEQGRAQLAACLRGGYAPFGTGPAAYRRLLFASAPARVQRAAVERRNPTPCGDVQSLVPTVARAGLTAADVEVPVLLLAGGRDARVRPLGAAEARAVYRGAATLTQRTFPAAGSALPLEAEGPQVRAAVLRWLRTL